MSELLVWIDGPADGPTNMAADEVLAAESVRRNRPLIRFYRWTSTTFSLGGFQRLAQATSEPLIASLPFVRRPSGGGGIIHGSDLTYAVAVPRDHPWGTRTQILYDAFHEALARTLTMRGVPTGLHAGHGPEAGDEHKLFCFERRARGDLVVPGTTDDGHKILGSAQRRLRAAVLQHGSLLLDTPHWDGGSAGYPGLAELFPKTRQLSQDELVVDWLTMLSNGTAAFGAFMDGSFVDEYASEIANAAPRFRAAEWLGRR
jgi:lipoate-protein ligase A